MKKHQFINESFNFFNDLFMKYMGRLNQSEYHDFLKKIQKHYTKEKLYNLFENYRQKRGLKIGKKSYDKMISDLLYDLNTYNTNWISFTEFMFNVFHKCISLFDKFNHSRNWDKNNIKVRIENIIKRQIDIVLPISSVIDQNIQIDVINGETISISFENDMPELVSVENTTLDLPLLNLMNVNEYILKNDNANHIIQPKLENKEINISLPNKKYVKDFYKNLV
jgi:hypothetical protein